MKAPYIFIGVIITISFLTCIIGWIVWRSKLKKGRLNPKVERKEDVDTVETFNARDNLCAHQKK